MNKNSENIGLSYDKASAISKLFCWSVFYLNNCLFNNKFKPLSEQ